jgi:hypothetical protein
MNEAAQHIGVRLEIEVDSQPIAGQVQVGDQVPRAFCSWLDLIAALDDAKKGDDR